MAKYQHVTVGGMSTCYCRAEYQYVTVGQQAFLQPSTGSNSSAMSSSVVWYAGSNFLGKRCRLYLQSTALLTLKIETIVASIISINTVSHNQHKLSEQFYYMATTSDPRLAI